MFSDVKFMNIPFIDSLHLYGHTHTHICINSPVSFASFIEIIMFCVEFITAAFAKFNNFTDAIHIFSVVIHGIKS